MKNIHCVATNISCMSRDKCCFTLWWSSFTL